MKKVFTLLLLVSASSCFGQYFQRFYNLNTTPGTKLRDEVFNSGQLTRFNFNASSAPDTQFLISVGTSYRLRTTAGTDRSDRLRFATTSRFGTSVLINSGYEFSTPNLQTFHGSGNGIAEIKSSNGSGGFVAVGAVASNASTGASAFGGSDALIVRLSASGGATAAVALNFGTGADTAWCVRRSNFQNNTFLVCGHSEDTTTGNVRCFVARVNASGGVIWAYTYNFDNTAGNGLSARSYARMLCENRSNGNIYVVGYQTDLSTANPNTDGLVFALSSTGGMLWSNIYHLGSEDQFKGIRLTADNNLAVAGHTNFAPAGTVPMVNMLALKIRALNGAITWQTVLRATSVTGATFDSRGYDILERRAISTAGTSSFEYYIAGPAYDASTPPHQLIYRIKSGGIPINSYVYNTMRIDSLFALDLDSAVNSPGLLLFSSIEKPTGMSSSHIIRATYQGATCTDLCVPNPPKSIPAQMVISPINSFMGQNYNVMPLVRTRYTYKTDLQCWQPFLNCNNPRPAKPDVDLVLEDVKVFPNPARQSITLRLAEELATVFNVRIVNSTGQLVWTGKMTGTGNVNISKLVAGTYFIYADDGSNKKVVRFIKQ